MCQNMIVILPWKKKDVKSSGTLENRGWTLALFAICFLSNRCGNTLGTITHTYLLTWLNTWGANTQGKFVWSDMIKRGCNEKETKEEKKKSDFIFIFGTEMHCHLSEMSKQTSTRGRRRRRRRQSMSSLLSWVLVIYIFNYQGLFWTNIFSLTSFITVSAQQRHSAHWNTPGLYWAPLATSEPMMSSWWMSQQDGDQQVCETRSTAGRDVVCRTWT